MHVTCVAVLKGVFLMALKIALLYQAPLLLLYVYQEVHNFDWGLECPALFPLLSFCIICWLPSLLQVCYMLVPDFSSLLAPWIKHVPRIPSVVRLVSRWQTAMDTLSWGALRSLQDLFNVSYNVSRRLIWWHFLSNGKNPWKPRFSFPCWLQSSEPSQGFLWVLFKCMIL